METPRTIQKAISNEKDPIMKRALETLNAAFGDEVTVETDSDGSLKVEPAHPEESV